MKLLQIYNGLAHYREPIYLKIDQTFNSDYLVARGQGDIKQMDYHKLRGDVKLVDSKHWHGLIFQPGLMSSLRKPYDIYLALGETHNVSIWWFAIMKRLFYPKKRLFFWSHGWYGKETGLERWLKKVFFRLPNGGTFLYGNYARELMIKEGFKPEKLFVIHNSLAHDQQVAVRQRLTSTPIYREHFGNSNSVLLFVGRLTKVKHLDMILEAMRLLRDKGREYNLVLIGDGEQRTQLETLTKELGLEKQVWFYGACYDEQQLGTLIYNADLCVSPGNVGLTAMHVMVFGTPVLTHNDFPHQMPEFEAVREGLTGLFFKYGSVESMANAICTWLEDNKNCREQVRKACFHEIDTQWTPQFQIEVLKQGLGITE